MEDVSSGGVICLQAGEHVAGEYTLEGKDVTIEGEGPDEVTLLGEGKKLIYLSASSSITLRSLTLDGFGPSDREEEDVWEDAVFTSSNTNLIYAVESEITLEDVVVTDLRGAVDSWGSTFYGGLFFATESNVTIDGLTIRDSEFNGKRAIGSTHRTTLNATNILVENLVSISSGGLMYIGNNSTAVIDGVVVENNDVSNMSSFFSFQGDEAVGTLRNADFRGNTIRAGMVSGWSATVTLENITVHNNASIEGPILYWGYFAPTEMYNVSVLGNEIIEGGIYVHGGGMEVQEGGLVAENFIFAGNWHEGDGMMSWIHISRADPVFRQFDFTNNRSAGAFAYSGLFMNYYQTVTLHNGNISGNVVDSEAHEGTTTATLSGEDDWFTLPLSSYDIQYVNIFGNSGGEADHIHEGEYEDLVGTYSVDPGYVSTTGDPWLWDLSLGTGSALIDAGDPSIDDPDGSQSDVGAFGGPGAADW